MTIFGNLNRNQEKCGKTSDQFGFAESEYNTLSVSSCHSG